MRDDRGSVTIWMLGLVMIMLAIGGMSLDLWRILAEKQRLELLADAAASAGAAVLDEGAFRTEGVVAVEPGSAEARALLIVSQGGPVGSVAVSADPAAVSVTLRNEVDLSLLSLLVPAEPGVVVQGQAVGIPRLLP